MTKLALAAAAAAAATVALLASPASAQEVSNGNVYGNLGYTQFDTDRGDLGGITGRLGYRFTPNFGAEAEYSAGVNDSREGKLNDAWGVYGVGTLPVSQQFDLLGRVGYQEINIDGRNGFSDRDGRGLGYGVGVQWHPAPTGFGIRGEYTRLTDADADTWSLSGVMAF